MTARWSASTTGASTATSTGRGVISALDLADLERFEFGRTAAVSGPQRTEPVAEREDDERPDEDAGRVLTLDRLLEYVISTPGQVRLAIETKHPRVRTLASGMPTVRLV